MEVLFKLIFYILPGNHKGVFKAAGFTQIKEYRYWDAATRGFDVGGMMEDLQVRAIQLLLMCMTLD